MQLVGERREQSASWRRDIGEREKILRKVRRRGHELIRRFTSRTRRLLRIKPKYGPPLSNVVGFSYPKRPCSFS
ncbi:hypothetical protein PIB30_049603 [Stylosanthes scabra]|uniref:Ribosomal protein S14 n=1 Tax=Stylosanthes scabra TaxID=79078 RepID=A0ABU6WK28_9FABA|nr:hypothetical protein [Stylosanthes scabra]